MALEKELDTYNRYLPEWSGHEGKYALIKEDEVVDLFSSYEDALKEGYKRFKLEPFMVKQISALQQAQFISRMYAPCLTSPSR